MACDVFAKKTIRYNSFIHSLQTNTLTHTHTHVMFWCPAEGTLSFDADDVGSPDPVPNLYDPQNHGAFGPRPARHQIA